MFLQSRTARCALLALWLELVTPRSSRAEGSLDYKFQSWQEAGGRIHVGSHSAMAEQTLPEEITLQLSGVIDSIAGATPSGQPPATPDGPVPLTHMEDERRAWEADLSRQFSAVNLSVGFANSRESDYLSRGWSVNSLTDFNDKNTTLLAGIAGTEDRVKVFYRPGWDRKHGLDAVIGIKQILDRATTLSANLSLGRDQGYLSDPYRVIEKDTDVGSGLVLPLTYGENRPDRRTRRVLFTSLNRAVDQLNGAVEASYRLYHDTYGITGHTLAVTWLQKLFADRWVLQPSLRWYTQSAADFYHVTLNNTSIVPGAGPAPEGPFYSADYRLSKFDSLDLGIKAIWTVWPRRLTVDVAYDRYAMHGRDQITSSSAYPKANVVTVGAKFTW